MKKYQELLETIVKTGIEKESGREDMPNTLSIVGPKVEHSILKDGFPLLTTKKMHFKGIVGELLWFLRGNSNIEYLVGNGINIWNKDAYKYYLRLYFKHIGGNNSYTFEEFVGMIKWGEIEETLLHKIIDYRLGDCGKIYGYQWRKRKVDQLKAVVEGLIQNPSSRYHIIDSWNRDDFEEAALPSCHSFYQFHAIGEDKLDVTMYQRSVDSVLGLPYNLASMALFLKILAKVSNRVANNIHWFGGDTHIYLDHLKSIEEQLARKPYQLPSIKINKELTCLEDIEALEISDFELVNYKSHPKLKDQPELFVGV